jgi:hypothetical protein
MQKQFPKDRKKKGGVLTTIENTTATKHGSQFGHRHNFTKHENKPASFENKREFGKVEKILVIICHFITFTKTLKKNFQSLKIILESISLLWSNR